MQIHNGAAVAVYMIAVVVGVATGLILARRRKPTAPEPEPEPAEEEAFPDRLRLWAFYVSARMAALKLGTDFDMATINGTTLDSAAINAAQAIGQQEGAQLADGTHREILTAVELEAAVRSLLGLPADPAKETAAAPKEDEVVR